MAVTFMFGIQRLNINASANSFKNYRYYQFFLALDPIN